MIKMKKPNFFIVGQTKSGTTSLKEYLMQHPDVFLSNPKWPRGKGHFGWFSDYKNNEEYLEEFQHASNEKMIGEKTTDYLFCPHTAERIKRFSPNAKIIMILRNPVDMMFSLHGHNLYNEAFEDLKDFEEALKAEEGRKKEYMDSKDKWHPHIFYREVARYPEQVQRYFDNFGRDNVKVIIFDDFITNTEKIYKETLEFLDVDPNFKPVYSIHNEARVYRSRKLQYAMQNNALGLRGILNKIPGSSSAFRAINQPVRKRKTMNLELRKKLQEDVKSEADELGNMLSRDLSFWCKN